MHLEKEMEIGRFVEEALSSEHLWGWKH